MAQAALSGSGTLGEHRSGGTPAARSTPVPEKWEGELYAEAVRCTLGGDRVIKTRIPDKEGPKLNSTAKTRWTRTVQTLLAALLALPAPSVGRELPDHKSASQTENPSNGSSGSGMVPCGIPVDRPTDLTRTIREQSGEEASNRDGARELLKQGLAAYSEGKLESAIAAFRGALRLRPDYADAHNALGNALYARSDSTGAMVEYRAAVRLKPSYGEAQLNLALVLDEQGGPSPPYEEYRTAVRLMPQDPVARYLLGIALFADRDPDGAIAELRKALKLKPGWPMARYRLGQILQHEGDTTGAQEQLRDLWKLGPNFPAILENCEVLMRRLKR